MSKRVRGMGLLALGGLAAALAFAPAAPTTAYADEAAQGQEAAGTYTVSFYGGATQQVKAGECATAPEAPKAPAPNEHNEWYPNGTVKFVGWYLDAEPHDSAEYSRILSQEPSAQDLEMLFDFSQPITGDLKLGAMFYAVERNVNLGVTVVDEGGCVLASQGLLLYDDHFYEGNTILQSSPDVQAYFERVIANYLSEYDGALKGYFYTKGYDDEGKLVLGDEYDWNQPVTSDFNMDAVIVVPGCNHGANKPGDKPSDKPTDQPSAPNASVEAPAVSGGTGITASGSLSGASIPEGAKVELSAAALSKGDADHDRLVRAAGSGRLAGVYSVSMLVNGSEVHDGFGSLTLTMPVDPMYNGRWVTVWHLHNDGTITSERVVAEGGAVTFAVTDLSSFALEIGEPAGAGDSSQPGGASSSGGGQAAQAGASAEGALPQTGDPAAIMGMVVTAGAALSASGAFIARRRNRNR